MLFRGHRSGGADSIGRTLRGRRVPPTTELVEACGQHVRHKYNGAAGPTSPRGKRLGLPAQHRTMRPTPILYRQRQTPRGPRLPYYGAGSDERELLSLVQWRGRLKRSRHSPRFAAPDRCTNGTMAVGVDHGSMLKVLS
jgi:hypothetical protein